MRFNRHIRGLGFVSSAVLIFFASARSNNAQAQELPEHLKPYSAGRLTSDDFLGKKTVSNRFAYTRAIIRFNYRYQYKTRGNVTTAELTQANVFAAFDRNISWLVQKSNAKLLDHEQGHFDIAQSIALKIHLALLKQIKSAAPIKAIGRSEQDMAAKIGTKINDLIDQKYDEMAKAHQQYDRLTRHGLSAQSQSESRKRQYDSITFLNNEIKRISNE